MKSVFAKAIALSSPLFWATTAVADEGGVSFWLPGTYGSLAAVPGTPGLLISTFNYYDLASPRPASRMECLADHFDFAGGPGHAGRGEKLTGGAFAKRFDDWSGKWKSDGI